MIKYKESHHPAHKQTDSDPPHTFYFLNRTNEQPIAACRAAPLGPLPVRCPELYHTWAEHSTETTLHVLTAAL